jgi:hypothetical protein
MSTEPMTPERVAEVQAALDAVPAPPWQWIGTPRTGPDLVTTHSGWQYVMGFERLGMQSAQPVFPVDTEGGVLLRAASEGMIVPRGGHDRTMIGDIDNPVARWIRYSAEYAQELLAEVGHLAAELADRTAERDTARGAYEVSSGRNGALVSEVNRLRRELEGEQAAHAKTVDAWETVLGLADGESLTVWRAAHDTIPLGLYLTRATAEEHCTTSWKRAVPGRPNVCWVPDSGDEDAPADLCYPDDDHDVVCTGYTVEPVTIASAFDPDGEE